MISETLLNVQVIVPKGQDCPAPNRVLPSGSKPQELLAHHWKPTEDAPSSLAAAPRSSQVERRG